jgi:mRNA interferase RelE/StbE
LGSCYGTQTSWLQKLTGREGWRIRSGDYRAIYEIDDYAMQITILNIGNRRDIYS